MRISIIRGEGAERPTRELFQPAAVSFDAQPIQWPNFLRHPDAKTFHHYPEGADVALCGAQRTSRHTNLTCPRYKLCVFCRGHIARTRLPLTPLTPTMVAILNNLANKRKWSFCLLRPDTAYELVKALDELVAKKLVKRGRVWLSPAGAHALSHHKESARKAAP